MPKLNAGRLRHRVRIEAPTRTQDPSTGAMTTTWQPLATVAASIEPLSVKDYIAGQQLKSQVSTRIVMRYRDDITPACRLVDTVKGTTYSVAGILPDADSGREYITVAASC